MPGEGPARSKRLAWLFVLAGLAMLAVGTLYAIYLSRERALAAPLRPEPPTDRQRLLAAVGVLTYTAIGVLAFLVGSLLMVRLGRLFLSRRVSRAATPYVDAWSAYRISDDQINAITGEGREPPGGPEAPGDSSGDPPQPKA